MSRTTIPPVKPLNPNVDLNEVLKTLHENAQYVMNDMDKAGDIVDHEYYAGLYDAYMHIREWITDPEAWPLAKKTSAIMRDPSTITGVSMNEQTATDLAETIVPETAAVASTLQQLTPFAIGVGVGAVAVVAGRRYYLKRQSRKVVVEQPES